MKCNGEHDPKENSCPGSRERVTITCDFAYFRSFVNIFNISFDRNFAPEKPVNSRHSVPAFQWGDQSCEDKIKGFTTLLQYENCIRR